MIGQAVSELASDLALETRIQHRCPRDRRSDVVMPDDVAAVSP